MTKYDIFKDMFHYRLLFPLHFISMSDRWDLNPCHWCYQLPTLPLCYRTSIEVRDCFDCTTDIPYQYKQERRKVFNQACVYMVALDPANKINKKAKKAILSLEIFMSQSACMSACMSPACHLHVSCMFHQNKLQIHSVQDKTSLSWELQQTPFQLSACSP